MVGILEKLTGHLRQKQAAALSSWAQFVVSVADGELSDLDAIAAELEQFRRSPADLQKAVDLLTKRRQWVTESADLAAAEAAVENARSEIEKEEQKFLKAHTAYERRMAELVDARNAAFTRIGKAEDAKRQLRETASQSAKSAAFAQLDEELSAAQVELGRLNHMVRDKSRWVEEVESLGSAASSSDIDRLSAQRVALKGLQSEANAVQSKLAALQARRNSADAELWKPEAGL